MGCGLPYAIAAAIAFPARQVVAVVGDGGISMSLAELATAARYRLPIKVETEIFVGSVWAELRQITTTP